MGERCLKAAAENAGRMIYRRAALRHAASGASQKVLAPFKSLYPVSEPVCRRGDRALSGLHLVSTKYCIRVAIAEQRKYAK
jgi:hypothetical protein